MGNHPLALISSLVLTSLVTATSAEAAGNPNVAALQVGLRAHGLYSGTVDGLFGRETASGVRRLQRRAGLAVDGIAGDRTRDVLGRYGWPTIASRVIRRGNVGWDVSALQFMLAWRGFPSGTFDGHFGSRTEAALRRFQRWARLTVDAAAGPLTLMALRSPLPRAPVSFLWPVDARPNGRFGPRGARFHTGLDFPSPYETPVRAARSGRVAYAGWHSGGWGYLVSVRHGRGVRTMYAHLSRVHVRVGQRVGGGSPVGRVGSTGGSTGPHLHFEIRLRGAAVDPLPALR
jgi:murein DD-endopeptidase MepM/ murein hydrolase activator NlpD